MPSIVISGLGRRGQDHFEPEASLDPQEQRRMKGYLDQIDYTAFAANREILAKAIGSADLDKFQRMAVATAHARADWVAAAIAITETSHAPSAAQIAQLRDMRQAYEELTEVYEAMRRMVERGYLHYQAKP